MGWLLRSNKCPSASKRCAWCADLTAVGRRAGTMAGIDTTRTGAGIGRCTRMPDPIGAGHSTLMLDPIGIGTTPIGAGAVRFTLTLDPHGAGAVPFTLMPD